MADMATPFAIAGNSARGMTLTAGFQMVAEWAIAEASMVETALCWDGSDLMDEVIRKGLFLGRDGPGVAPQSVGLCNEGAVKTSADWNDKHKEQGAITNPL